MSAGECTCGRTACESDLCDCDAAPCPVDHVADALASEGECGGICLYAADIGVPEAGNVVAYAHPDCPAHGDPPTDEAQPKRRDRSS